MTIVYYLVLTLHIICCLFLVGVVLLQQGKGQDLASAFGGGVTQTAFGPRGSANLLSRATTILASLFMVTSLALSVLRPQQSFLESLPAAAPAAASPTAGAPAGGAAGLPTDAPVPADAPTASSPDAKPADSSAAPAPATEAPKPAETK